MVKELVVMVPKKLLELFEGSSYTGFSPGQNQQLNLQRRDNVAPARVKRAPSKQVDANDSRQLLVNSKFVMIVAQLSGS